MGNRNHDITAVQEYFHCYNRGTDKRTIFEDQQDYAYFLKSLRSYNTEKTSGKLRLSSEIEVKIPLVTVVSYCLLPNHFHLILKNEVEGGISKFLQRVSTGYTLYFNQKYKRSGSLFQGVFKSRPVSTDQNLQQLISYVYCNNKIHNISDKSLYRNYLDTSLDIVRGETSNYELLMTKMEEIAEIIKLSRLDLE